MLLPFSCKGRGVCPSCQARRMYETAALSAALMDAFSPPVLRRLSLMSRLSLTDDGLVRYKLKRPWPRPGGITCLTLQPTDFLRRLACLIPPPRTHLIRYHGVFSVRLSSVRFTDLAG
jgi:hypothetical protein